MDVEKIIEIIIYLVIIAIVVYFSLNMQQNYQIGGKTDTFYGFTRYFKDDQGNLMSTPMPGNSCYDSSIATLKKGGIWKTCYSRFCLNRQSFDYNHKLCGRIGSRMVAEVTAQKFNPFDKVKPKSHL
jgi:hypothetical protein